jgi:rubrerythrin
MSLVRLIQRQLVFKNLFKQQKSVPIMIKHSGLATSNKEELKEAENEEEFADPDMTPEKEEKLENEKKLVELISQKQNVSRFSTKHAENKFYDRVPMLAQDSLALSHKKFFRKMYVRHGSEKTNIDPRICWPSRDELKEMIEDEKNYDNSLKDKIDMIAKIKYDQASEVFKR